MKSSVDAADKEHTLNEYAHLYVLTELTREHTYLVHLSEHTHSDHALCLLASHEMH